MPTEFILIPIAGMATGTIFMFGIYKLITKWMELRHRPAVGGVSAEELQDLRDDVALLRDMPDRVAELEERLDFTERLLAQARRERSELNPGGAPHA
ncbi:MAG: hypothetical protein OEY20_08470 [Gemmatimonadota bacterium]|nr:hypothetical protein [Gemmatimonadota bacterium]MDH4349620.1 hypothetical protein [Gemmatimonadota bacterium]MDH5197271.1 hypothetical protein [Gemmatimonadota bacterium]